MTKGDGQFTATFSPLKTCNPFIIINIKSISRSNSFKFEVAFNSMSTAEFLLCNIISTDDGVDGCLPERQLPRPTCFIQSTLATRFLVGKSFTLENNIHRNVSGNTTTTEGERQLVVASFSELF